MICVVLKDDRLTIKEIANKISSKFDIRPPNRETIYRSLQMLLKHDIVGRKKAMNTIDSDRYFLRVIRIEVDFINNTINFVPSKKKTRTKNFG